MAEESKSKGQNIFAELVRTLVSVVEEKDVFIRGHSERVARACVNFAKKLGLPKAEIDKLYLAGLLHDIGMVYVPMEIILKPERLTDEEMLVVRQHPVVAEKILSDLPVLKGVLPIIRHHHEAYDGSGYPDCLKGAAIPLATRILSLMDAYDAMASQRPQREALSRDRILAEVQRNAGRQFDGTLAKKFLAMLAPASAAQTKEEPAPAVSPQDAKKEPSTIKEFIAETVRKYKDADIFLPILPKVVQDVGKVLKDPNATSDSLADIIEKDAAITIKLITVANSAIYRGAEKVTTVRNAIPRLGLKETQNIIYAISAKGLYKADKPLFKVVMKKLWLHSLASAYSARSIAGQLSLGDVEKFFLMGLIHDIGKVLLVKAFTEEGAFLKQVSVEDIMAGIQEAHAGFGSQLLEQWGFGQDMIRAAEMHNNAKFFPTTKKEVLVVSLASSLTRTIGYSLTDDDTLSLVSLESAKLLGMDAGKLETVRQDVASLMHTAAEVF